MSTPQRTPSLEPDLETVYNRAFWIAYLANTCLVTANALTFRFAELVNWLGGTQELTGQIVSTGVVAALVARCFLGQAIDRYGARRLWLINSVLFTIGGALLTQCAVLSPLIYAARICFAVGLAGMFTSSIVHIQNRIPVHRRTEVIGSLGSSGFLGMILGTQLGDAIFHWVPRSATTFDWLFGMAAVLGGIYIALVLWLTRHDLHRKPKLTPAVHHLMRRYWPGPVLLVAIMMGTGFAVITVFLTRFATAQGLGGIRTFFTSYAIAAFVLRVSTRNWSRTVGRHRMILIGLLSHCIGFCILPEVTADWHFIFPALFSGFGHALLFPAVVSLGAGCFPRIFHGTGTTIVLGFFDLGTMLSAPLLGWIIDTYEESYGFAPMFYTAAGFSLFVAAVYGLTAAREVDTDIKPAPLPATSPTGESAVTATTPIAAEPVPISD